ncbi:MAG: hypothetical protein R3C53_14595 [Pirellulaceae bacterium]
MLILIVALAVVATILCYRAFEDRVDQGLRAAVSDQLRDLFPDASVFVGRVTADGPNKLVVSDVRIAGQGGKPKREVFAAERVELHGDLDIAHYLQQSIRVKQVELFGLTLDAWPLPDGSWSLSSLQPKPNPLAPPPDFKLSGATLRIHSDASPNSSFVALHDISGQIEHRLVGNAVDNLDVNAHVQLTGRSNGLLQAISVDAHYRPKTQSIRATGAFEGLDFSPKVITQLPPQLSKYLSQLSGLQCRATSTFEVISDGTGGVGFQLLGRLSDGRLRDPRLPYPLENLRGDFFCKNSLLQLRSMQARSGTTQLTLSTDIHGFSLDSPMEIQAQAKNLELDQGLYQSLPSSWQAQWDRLQLAGTVSGNISLSFDGRVWRPSAVIECHDVSLKPWLFPYPLTGVRGHVVYDQGRVRTQRLDGRAGGQDIWASLDLSKAGESEWLGTLSCATAGPISIDEQLLDALTPSDRPQSGVEQFVRSLHPSSGTIELRNATFERTAEMAVWGRKIDANVYGATLNYDGFQYPLYNVRGRVYGQDDNWVIDNFEGRNDSGRILCSGRWLNVREGQVPFFLQFHAFDVPAEEELQAALPSDAQYIWEELQPSGAVDSVLATITRPNNLAPVDVRIELTEDSDPTEVAGRSLSLLPKSFPYRLTEVACHITYEPGFISIERATAVNGSTRLAMTGECRPTDTGRWQADVRWLPTTRVIVDGQLLKALPRTIRDSLVKLDFSGPISIFGGSQILFGNQDHPTPMANWKCQLDIEDGRLADGTYIGDLRGTVWIEGQSDGTEIVTTGTLGMDALTVRGIPITALQGPFALRGTDLFFGTTVTDAFPRVGAPSSPALVADALSGKLTLSGRGRLDIGKFMLDAQLEDAQLTALLQDVGVERASTQATCDATLNFQGIPWSPQTFSGGGLVSLSDAKLYQLPFLMRFLRTAAVNAADDSAFQTAEIEFQIVGDLIPLKITCEGDVLRLRGEGRTSLRRDIVLELWTYVGRRIPISNVVSPLLAESKYASFMKFEVTGTLDDPVMQRVPFPQLDATLQQMFPEVAEKRPLRDAMPWRR